MINSVMELGFRLRRAQSSSNQRRGTLLLPVMLVICDASFAANTGAYVGVGIVESSVDVDSYSQVLRTQSYFGARPEQFENQRSTGWSIVGGYRFGSYLAVEAGFTDFGVKALSPPSRYLTFFSNTSSTYIEDTRISEKGAYWALKGSLPIGKWEPYVKLGAFRAETTGTTRSVINFYSGPGRTLTSSTERDDEQFDTSTEAMITLGVGYTVASHYVFALEAMRIPKVGNEKVTGEGNLTSLSLAFQYRF